LSENIGKLYTLRSNLVHDNISPFDEGIGVKLYECETVARRVLLRGLSFFQTIGLTIDNISQKRFRRLYKNYLHHITIFTNSKNHDFKNLGVIKYSKHRWISTTCLNTEPSSSRPRPRCLRSRRHPTCNAPSPPAASRAARSANSRRHRASAPARGRCGPCRAAMSKPSRTARASRRRSTRVTYRRKPTAAPSSKPFRPGRKPARHAGED
jgi:hypothetical protein